MIDHTQPDPINLAEIARLAGVGRAAVGNWRRCHHDFPEPVGSTQLNTPTFALADIQAWPATHGLLPTATAPPAP
ncbi:hypothetical protein ACGFNU_14710 [Spirillospora sp. NPDC048911]|uniref:hypothetical protein n=1 Tax=Spirillospora sp. NPDC048911 TaxID=3364527 RepID=UPI00371E409E